MSIVVLGRYVNKSEKRYFCMSIVSFGDILIIIKDYLRPDQRGIVKLMKVTK